MEKCYESLCLEKTTYCFPSTPWLVSSSYWLNLWKFGVWYCHIISDYIAKNQVKSNNNQWISSPLTCLLIYSHSNQKSNTVKGCKGTFMIVKLRSCKGMWWKRTYGPSNSKGLTASAIKGFGVCNFQVFWIYLILWGLKESWRRLRKKITWKFSIFPCRS